MSNAINADTFGYAAAAPLYRAAGWTQVIPLPEGRKKPPPSGYTGTRAVPVDDATVNWWSNAMPNANTGIVIPAGVLILDVDSPDGHKRKEDGAEGLGRLEQELGPLPETWSSTAHGYNQPYRHRFYRVPDDIHWNGNAIGGIDVIQPIHRYSVVWPSVHPTGEQYQWYTPAGEPADHIPSITDLAELPDPWVQHLRKPERPARERALMFTTTATSTSGMCKAIRTFLDTVMTQPAAKGSRHDTMLEAVWALIRFKEEGHQGVDEAIRVLRPAFIMNVAPDRDGREEEAAREFDRIVDGARTKNYDQQGAVDPCDHASGMDTRMSDAELAQIEQYANTPQTMPDGGADARTAKHTRTQSQTAAEAAQTTPQQQSGQQQP
ncbi:MAG: bifunctional DNA primase/polymerase, partial [Bifidobacterium castoris]|nr:bifunctional DNA primase/polymerase [Bifidobacterium castoris]